MYELSKSSDFRAKKTGAHILQVLYDFEIIQLYVLIN
jgi:hypothetical protein